MSSKRKLLGSEGEQRAARYLEQQGYRILERNYQASCGEIDLIALDRGELVFVEVKTRSTDAYGSPELAVTPRKQQRMIRAALGYVKHRGMHQVPCRFDVVAVRTGAAGGIDVIRHAFAMDRDGR